MKKLVFILLFSMLMMSACGTKNENVKTDESVNDLITEEENKETELESPDAQAKQEEENKEETTTSNTGDKPVSNEVEDKSSNEQQSNTQQSKPQQSTTQQSQPQQSTPAQTPSTNQNSNSSSQSTEPEPPKKPEEPPKVEQTVNVNEYWSYYEEVLNLVNQLRTEAGVAPLTLDKSLCKAAIVRANEMAQSSSLSHTRPNGTYFNTVLADFGISYRTCGENIAAGQSSPAQVVSAWKNSTDHYNNMVDPDYTKLGMGYSPSNDKYQRYWSQLFKN